MVLVKNKLKSIAYRSVSLGGKHFLVKAPGISPSVQHLQQYLISCFIGDPKT